MAERASLGWRNRRSPHRQQRSSFERLHGAFNESELRARFFHSVLPKDQVGYWLRLEAARLSLDGHMGRKPQPHRSTMEWKNFNARYGVWRLSYARIAAPNDGPQSALWGSHV